MAVFLPLHDLPRIHLLPRPPLLVLLLFDECEMEFNPDLGDTRASLSLCFGFLDPAFLISSRSLSIIRSDKICLSWGRIIVLLIIHRYREDVSFVEAPLRSCRRPFETLLPLTCTRLSGRAHPLLLGFTPISSIFLISSF